MNEQEVKDYLWEKFLEFIEGQTVGIDEDGNTNYYDWDVERFIS